MLDKLSQQQRIIIAVALSIVFFISYEAIFPRPMPEQKTEQKSGANTGENASASTSENALPGSNLPGSSLPSSAPSALPSSTAANAVNAANSALATLKSPVFTLSLNKSAELSSFVLEAKKFKDAEVIDMISSPAHLPFSLLFYDAALLAASKANPFTLKNELKLDEWAIFTQDLGLVELQKHIKFSSQGNWELKLRFCEPGLDPCRPSATQPAFVLNMGARPDVIADGYTVHGLMLQDREEKKHMFDDGDVKVDEEMSNINIAALSDRYYTNAIYDFDKSFKVIISSDKSSKNTLAYLSHSGDLHIHGYLGPKDHDALRGIDKRLGEIVEYGWFTFIARPMFKILHFIHSHTNNWGWAIVIMTLLLRIVLFPLTYKGMVSMQKLKVLAPKIKELQEKYKGEPQKMQAQMMELYKKHGANPMGGCLPILLQIPVFFAIYRVLLNAIELKAAPWALWIGDLAAKDPYFILPIIMGGTMFLQQVITPMSIQDPMQAKIMKFLPLIFTFFFLTFPAGLTLYWCVNNTCSLIQQYTINKMFKKREERELSGPKA